MKKILTWFLVALVCLTAAAPAAFADTSAPDSEHESLGVHIARMLRRSGLPDSVSVFLISMLPVVELRGAVPAGHLFGMHPLVVFLVAVAGNMLPIPFIL